jgi:predicted ATPase
MALGPHLKELRAKAGLSQGALAERVKIDVTYLSKLENGRQRASDRVLRSLAMALGVEPVPLLVMAGRIPTELQGMFQTSLLGEANNGTISLTPPRYRTCFVDRGDDRVRLQLLLEEAGRLVTVTGPPGCGKTRLAAEVVGDLATQSRPIAWICIREDDRDRIGAALALAQGTAGGVVVLDDADRDLETCTAAARRMIAGGLTVLATSRQPLGLYAERLLRLGSLALPDRHLRPSHDDGQGPDLGRLQEQESVRLFVDRATLAEPDFRLDRTNATAVFDVCRWLDGLPLAIELAALRLRQMTVADLAANIHGLLTWLTGNTADVPDRHASLAAAIGWSFRQLDPEQHTVAIRLSVFDKSFTLADAAKVASDDRITTEHVMQAVMDLVLRSVLIWQQNANGRAEYRWLHPMRQYGMQQLEREADREQTTERYASWVRQVVESFQDDLPRRESDWARLAELSPELVSTVYHLPAAEQQGAMAQLTDALSISLQFGNLADHVEWFSARFGEKTTERSLFREAGIIARVRGEFDEAHRNFDRAHMIAREDRDELGQAHASLDLAENALDRGSYVEAEEHVTRAGELYERQQDDRGRIEVLSLGGKLRLEQSDTGPAERMFTDALQLAQQVGDSRLIAYSLHNLGICDYRLRRVTSARSRLEESLRLRGDMRNLRGVARVIEAFSLVESEIRNHELALRLLGAARQYRRSSGAFGVPPWWSEQLEAVEQRARTALASEPEVADQLLASGAAMSLSEASEQVRRSASDALTGRLPEPVTSPPLRRPIPSPHIDLHQPAEAVAATAGDETTALEHALLELEPGGSAADAHRHLHRARLLALAEPVESRMTDLLCFSIDPDHYSGVVVPVFTSGRVLGEMLERHPDWGSRPVVEVRFEHLRASLVRGETAVINPWTSSEYRISPTEHGHAPSTEAPASVAAASGSGRGS